MRITLPIRQVWTFKSDSSDREYETLQYKDGTTSCNCPGWTKRVGANGVRSCKHTRWVDQGIADRNAASTHNYANPTLPPVQAVRPVALPIGEFGTRKLAA